MFVESGLEVSFCRAYINFFSIICCCDTSLVDDVILAAFVLYRAAGFISTVARGFVSFIILIADLSVMAAYKCRDVRGAAVRYFNVISVKYFIEFMLFLEVFVQ